jgi:hypothetical protein
MSGSQVFKHKVVHNCVHNHLAIGIFVSLREAPCDAQRNHALDEAGSEKVGNRHLGAYLQMAIGFEMPFGRSKRTSRMCSRTEPSKPH